MQHTVVNTFIYSVVIVLNLLHFILYNNAITGRFFHHSVCMNVCQGKQDLLVNSNSYNQLADVILLVEVQYPAHNLDYLGHIDMVGLLGMLVMLKCQTPTTQHCYILCL